MKRKIFSNRLALIFAIAAQLICPRGFAWTEQGHSLGNYLALAQMGDMPYGPWLAKQDYLLQRYAITPDVDWKSDFYPLKNPILKIAREKADLYEHSNHFLSWDAYYPRDRIVDAEGKVHTELLDEFPHDDTCRAAYDKLARMLGANADIFNAPGMRPLFNPEHPTPYDVYSQGALPWRVIQIYDLAVGALEKGDFQKAVFYLGIMGHYVEDLAQPFHNTVKFNPFGIHVSYEGRILEIDAAKRGLTEGPDYVWQLGAREKDLAKELKGKDSTLKPLSRDEIIPRLLALSAQGYAYVDPITQAYHWTLRGRPELDNPWKLRPPADLLEKFGNTRISDPVNGIKDQTVLDSAYQRLGVGSTLLAELWMSAFAEAAKKNPKLLDSKYYADKTAAVPVRTDLGESPDTPEARQGFSQAFAIFNYPILDRGDKPKRFPNKTPDERQLALPAPTPAPLPQ